jgi:glucose/arabinose dehydrogenase
MDLVVLSLAALTLLQNQAPKEADYYEIITLPIPEDLVLEVSGVTMLPDGRPLVCSRRGYVYVLENAFAEDPADVRFHEFAMGLQEPLGLLAEEDGWIYLVQRGELSRMRDLDGDDRIDELETICDSWPISGNYHEYNFGPVRDDSGWFWITTNKPFGEGAFGRADWRGFALRISPEGKMVPTCSGLRSPAGIGKSPWGDIFYTDNQGEWCGASKLSHLEPGDFHGHPYGTFSCELPEWTFPPVGDVPDGELMPLVKKTIPSFKLPAVWFPYDKMGKSPAGFVWDTTDGLFGPFGGQLFVTDQHHASVMRVTLERIGGHWQGACYPFRENFQCGAIRCAWGQDGSLFVGMTNRGWGGRGNSPYGLQRLRWKGVTPFEILSMNARSYGFTLRFTAPVDPKTASDPAGYRMESYTYKLHSAYGSPEVEKKDLEILEARVSRDGLEVELEVHGLRAGYVHELHATGVLSRGQVPLLHQQAYYTLIQIPGS